MPHPPAVPRAAVLALLWLALSPATARADAISDLEDALLDAFSRTTEAAVHVARDDLQAALDARDAAEAAATAATGLAQDPTARAVLGGRGAKRTDKKIAKLAERLDAAETTLGTAGTTLAEAVKALQRAAQTAAQALAKPRQKSKTGPDIRGGLPFLKARKKLNLRVRGENDATGLPCEDAPAVTVTDLADLSVDETPQDRGKGRFRVFLIDAPGGARIDVTTCGKTRTWHVVNKGTKGALDGPLTQIVAPTIGGYDEESPSYRVDETIAANAPMLSGGLVSSWEIDPALPAGLLFDTATGSLTGTPTAAALRTDHDVTASNGAGQSTFTLSIQVTPELPDDVHELEPGFVIEKLYSGLATPAKLALLPDGRVLFNELATGNTRVIAADGTLRTTPFATTAVEPGGHRGLLGLAVSPTFETDGFVYVYASVPAGGGKPIRNQVIRYTAVGDVGGAPTVIVDDLPAGIINNAGDLQFGPDDKLYVSVGDTDDPDLAQTDGSPAGRVLRLEPDGGIPTDNPDPSDPEFVRGLRNTYDLTFHPVTGGLFGSENGPMAEDELNFLQPDKNFGWGPVPPDLPAFRIGVRLIEWTPVIVPTGILFLADGGFGAEYEDSLFVCEYDEAALRRLVLSGPNRIDLDDELPFLALDDSGSVDNKPLDALEAPDGSLWFSTFEGLWRVAPYEEP